MTTNNTLPTAARGHKAAECVASAERFDDARNMRRCGVCGAMWNVKMFDGYAPGCAGPSGYGPNVVPGHTRPSGLPAATDSRQPCEDVSSTHRFTGRTEDGHLKHDPATCWWCLNESAEYCDEMKKAMIGDGSTSKLRVKLDGGKMSFHSRTKLGKD